MGGINALAAVPIVFLAICGEYILVPAPVKKRALRSHKAMC
jgi:hypothetical protein